MQIIARVQSIGGKGASGDSSIHVWPLAEDDPILVGFKKRNPKAELMSRKTLADEYVTRVEFWGPAEQFTPLSIVAGEFTERAYSDRQAYSEDGSTLVPAVVRDENDVPKAYANSKPVVQQCLAIDFPGAVKLIRHAPLAERVAVVASAEAL